MLFFYVKFLCPLKHFNKQQIMCLISKSPSEPEHHQRKKSEPIRISNLLYLLASNQTTKTELK